MKKEKRILVVFSLLFTVSTIFVFLNALDIKLGFAGGGCPDCLCNVCGNASPCGAVCPCGTCPEGTICDGTNCVSCSDLGANCGIHSSSIPGCTGTISCGADGTEYCAAADGCECDGATCSACTPPNACVNHACTPPAGCVNGTCSGADICVGGVWVPHCSNGVKDCDETGVDCGGASCAACAPAVCVPACGECQACVGGVCVAANEGNWCGSTWETCSDPATCDAGVYQHKCSGGSCTGTYLKNSASNACNGRDCGTCCICNGETPTADNSQDGDCGECKECGGLKTCNNVTGETGTHGDCTADCHDCVAGSCDAVTEADDGGCTGATSYCCSGICVNPTPAEYGTPCGSGDCSRGETAVWECDGSDYKCSSKGDGCDYCSGDYWYDSSCNKDGECPAGTENSCDECNTCEDKGAFTKCIAAYERIQDTVDPNLCNGAGQVCHDGGCCDLHTCGHGADECGLGLDDNCGGTIDCYCDKTDASCECVGGSCQPCAGTDANCWCDNTGSGAGGKCESCHRLKVCKVDGAGNKCIGRGIVSPSVPSDVPDDFEQSIINITNWLAGFVVMLAVLAMIYGGFIYLSSSGDQEKAAGGKRVVTYALLGLIIAGIAYAVVKVIVNLL